jgi:hypothetical protein
MTASLPDELPGPSIKWIYHLSRLVFGAWWLFSGCMHFFWPELQPLRSISRWR